MYSIAPIARRGAWLIAAFCTAAVALRAGRAGAQTVRPLPYTRTVLPNGLVVLMNEDHSSPIVAVDVWYHIGAKDEKPGHTALAHVCEHLMGLGSPNQPLEPKVFIARLGGTANRWAETTQDITHYYATVPSNQLETVLWLESDRMAFPLTRADSAHLGSVREVIRQERAQSEEAKVYGFAEALVAREILDAPYHIDPVGAPEDLNIATAEDAKSFCAPYYVPNNAVVSLSGDFTSATARALVTKYFGPIPRGATPTHPTVVSSPSATLKRIVLEDGKARTTQFRRIWVGAATDDRDRLALLALGAVLSRDRIGRLSKALVYDRPLATGVDATNFDLEKSGVFQIVVVPRPNVSMSVIEAVVDSVLADVKANGLTDAELEPYKKSNAVLAITMLQSRAARADTLANGEVFEHDPAAYASEVNATSRLTSAAVLRVTKKYLTPGGVIMSLVPAGKLDLIAHPELPYKNVTPTPVKVTP